MYQARIQLLAKCLLLFVTFILIEVVLRITKYPHLLCEHISRTNETVLGQYDSDVGWRWQANRSFSNHGVNYHFDSVGLRAPHFGKEVDFSKPRLLFVGDSVAYGYGLNYEQTYAAKIGQLLGESYSIVNAAVEGYGSDQAYIRMQQVMEYVRPTAIVVTFIADHNTRNLNRDRRQELRCFEFPAYKPVPALIDDRLILRSPAAPIIPGKEIVSLTAISDLYDRIRMHSARASGYDIAVSQALMRAMATAKVAGSSVPVYFIYYDAHYSEQENFNDQLVAQLFYTQGLRVLPFYNWAHDSDNAKYYAEPDDFFHPGDMTTSYIAEAFVKKFGMEINGLAATLKK